MADSNALAQTQSEGRTEPAKSRRRTPEAFKSLTRQNWVRGLLCWVAATYIRFVYNTSRWTVIDGDTPRELWDQDKPFILAFWHNRLLMMPYCWRSGKPMNMLISQHRDGELIARTIGHFKLGSVRGSAGNAQKGGDKMTGKGGFQALRTMAKAAAAGQSLGITPDGPRGPRMQASEGVAAVARLTGLPVIPCAYAATNARILKSWDRFVLALPFSRGVFVWGEAIQVKKSVSGEDLIAVRETIEAELNRVSAAADKFVGRTPIEAEPQMSKETRTLGQ